MIDSNFFSENVPIYTSGRRRRSLREIDPVSLVAMADERLDWPISRNILNSTRFDRSILRQCWMDQLSLKSKKYRQIFLIFYLIYSFR